jgi:hypothetical protein
MLLYYISINEHCMRITLALVFELHVSALHVHYKLATRIFLSPSVIIMMRPVRVEELYTL